jgi:hypothetical protein
MGRIRKGFGVICQAFAYLLRQCQHAAHVEISPTLSIVLGPLVNFLQRNQTKRGIAHVGSSALLAQHLLPIRYDHSPSMVVPSAELDDRLSGFVDAPNCL